MKTWDTTEILKFSSWLWDEKHYAYSLLTIHGICFGIKVSQQLKLKWSDLINEKNKPKAEINVRGNNILISSFASNITEIAFEELKPLKTDLVYVNTKTNKIIEISNLSKNLNRLKNQYLIDEYGENVMLIEDLGAFTFQKVWALENLKKHNFSKDAFIGIGYYLGKKTIPEMVKFVGIEPIEKEMIKPRFDIIDDTGVQIVRQHRGIRNRNKLSDFGFVFKE